MKTTALHEFVKQVFSDEVQKGRFESDPAGFLADFDLAEDEKKAILSTSGIRMSGSDTAALQAEIQPLALWQ